MRSPIHVSITLAEAPTYTTGTRPTHAMWRDNMSWLIVFFFEIISQMRSTSRIKLPAGLEDGLLTGLGPCLNFSSVII